MVSTTPPATAAVSVPITTLADITPAGDPNGVSLTLEGCRNNGNITLPIGGKFVCPDPAPLGGTDSAYTSGNLGKGWNELDLVPYRVIARAGNSAPANQTYTVAIVVDKKDDGKPGYDVLSVPVLNTALSSASGCSAATFDDPAKTLTPGLGGIDESLYRRMNISQAKNTTCVYDYYARLALGSHEFPGSSLHANLANKDLGTAGVGARDVSIPVKEILPQELRKTMGAVQGSDSVWNIIKSASPLNVQFLDTCDANAPRSKPVTIRVEWTKGDPTPSGQVTVTTSIYARNPASRLITVNVTDVIRSGTTVLDTVSTPAGGVDVDANQEKLVLTHTFLVPAGTTSLNDVATATYTDKATGVPVPGTTTATASATVQNTGPTANQTATVTDVEGISGAGLSYSADSFSGAGGSFDSPYVAGAQTTGSVGWTSATQSASGSVDFSKTVYVGAGVSTSGTLSDTATITTSGGVTSSAPASVIITADARVKLSIDKTIPNVLQTGESQTFTFRVKDGTGTEVATPTITFGAGETSKSVTVSNLAPGTYTVSEDAATGWAAQSDQQTSINLPSCSGSVSFANTFTPANAKVVKTVVSSNPADTVQGWDFTLTRTSDDPDTAVATGTTDADGKITFTGGGATLTEGSYAVTETQKAGYDQTGAVGCTFTVNYPADSSKTFTCAAENTKRPTLKVVKVVVNNYGGTKVVSDFTLKVDGNTVTSGVTNEQTIGQHTVSEVTPLPSGYEQVGITGDCDATGKVTLSAGDNKTCTITNRDRPGTIIVIKNAKPANGHFAFETTGTGYNGFSLNGDPTGSLNKNTQTNLSAGTYTVKEGTQLGWILTGIGGSTDPATPYNCVVTGSGGSTGSGTLNDQTAKIDLKNGDTVTCVFENTGQGVTRTQGFWQTHPELAIIAWNGGQAFNPLIQIPGVAGVPAIGDRMLCGKNIAAGAIGTKNSSDLMGGFWSGISNKSNGTKRTSLDQNRMQLLQQMLAAQLNASAFGSVPSGGMGKFAEWESAFCGTSITAITKAQQEAGVFNNSGDSGTFSPGTSANSKAARYMANYARWDSLP